MYLLIKCVPLNDDYECDADRIPITLTSDYKRWINRYKPSYPYEVWQLTKNETFKKIKEWE